MVEIREEEYKRLLENDMWLDALDAAGVDNWQGIDEARKIFLEMKAEDE